MKLKKYVLIAGMLSLKTMVPVVGWGQPTHQVAPAEGKATVEGSVQDAQTKRPIAGATVLAKTQDGIVRAQQVTKADGTYFLTLNSQQSYIFTAKAEGYIPLEEQLSFTSEKTYHLTRKPTLLFRMNPSAAKSVVITHSAATTAPVPASQAPTMAINGSMPPAGMPPEADKRAVPPKTLDAKVTYTPPLIVAPIGKATQLQALQFVQSQAELLPSAQPAMEQLVGFMRDHPTAEIELAGHTDNQGDFDKNLLLSKQRVDVVKDYLVKNGIAASRITTRGYGPTRPIASNNHEATRQLNRRVEMTVLKQ